MKMFKMCGEVYLDNAATSRFKPFSVIRAINNELKFSANPGRSAHSSALKSAMVLEAARAEIMKITGIGNVVLTKNCTEALNLAVFGYAPQGEIITSVFEHNSVLRPLHKLETQGAARIKYIKPASNIITAKEVSKLITQDTRMIVLSEMSNVTGAMHEIPEIAEEAKKRGIKILLDTAQSMGHSAYDYKDIDMIAASGHKGLHSPQGTGFLFFKDGINLKPLLYGGTGTMGVSAEQPNEIPEGFESGTLNTLGFSGLCEGIKWTLKNKEKINKKIKNLSEYLLDGLRVIKGVNLYTDNYNGVISFNIASVPSTDVADILSSEYNISVRSGIHCAPLAHLHIGTLKQGAVRASIGYNNGEHDVEKLIDAVKSIAKKESV